MGYEFPKRYELSGYPVTLQGIGSGFNAIENTVKIMAKTIRESSRNIRVRNMATAIVYNVPEKDQMSEASAVLGWVHNNTRYVRDPQGTETLHSPLVALDKIEQGFQFQGDCDDSTTLTLSLLKSIGFPVRIRIAAYNQESTKKYSHVYGMVKINGVWYPVESIEKGAPVGWENPNFSETKDYEV
ncbi:MAG TPA: hypothetical protein DHV25_03175 [Candidatus Kerfeldbacteria bacterium]|nr:hypothetical protein [Candidatus Kerfeldbacteria bacterium]